MIGSFNLCDLLIFLIIGISGAIGHSRGSLRGIFSLLAWSGAGVITWGAFPHLAKFVRHGPGEDAMQPAILALCVYTAALAILSFINSLIMRHFHIGMTFGGLDAMLGMLLGIILGGFIVTFLFILLGILFTEYPSPDWLSDFFADSFFHPLDYMFGPKS